MSSEEYPEMLYEIAGKEAYAREAPVRFQTNGMKFVAYPDGHYEQVSEVVEPVSAAGGEGDAPVIHPASESVQERHSVVDCSLYGETADGGVTFTCPKEQTFKEKKDALMVVYPRAVASATAARIRTGASLEVRYTALVRAAPGSTVCLVVAVADNLCEAINSAWLVACDVMNGEGDAGNPSDLDRYNGERAMADVARKYLKAKGLDLQVKAHLNWNDVASWMGYFAYEQLLSSGRTVELAAVPKASAATACSGHDTSCGGCSVKAGSPQKDGQS